MATDSTPTNKFLVSVQGRVIVILADIPPALSKTDALNLAAWLVVLADDTGTFSTLLDAVQNT